MSNVFTIAEIVDIGIEKEKRRSDFYARVAGHFQQKSMRDLFTKLRDWEIEHIQKFSEIRSGLDDSEVTETYSGELSRYMGSIVDDKLYAELTGEAFSKLVTTPFDAIRYGIGFEKDAIIFFNELAECVDPEHCDLVRALVDEEKKHIVYLAELKESVAKEIQP